MKGKTSQYLKYAIGEIILVMIGILLALQVNNWNENRKLKQTLNNALNNISNNLEADTTAAGTIVTYYEATLKNSSKIIKGEITKDNYKECYECLNLVTIYKPFNIQVNGFEQLNQLNDGKNSQKDSLIIKLNTFYSQYQPVIDKNNERMEDIVMSNFRDFEKQDWFIDMAQGNLTEDLISYFTESEDYKRRVASHAMLAVGNHMGIAKQYKEDAIELLELINKRMENEN